MEKIESLIDKKILNEATYKLMCAILPTFETQVEKIKYTLKDEKKSCAEYYTVFWLKYTFITKLLKELLEDIGIEESVKLKLLLELEICDILDELNKKKPYRTMR